MVVLPLIIFSIISGISGLDRQTTGIMGGYAVAYYGITTILAVILGIVMCITIKPGKLLSDSGFSLNFLSFNFIII